jgi:putative Holliday junction resolvase
VKKRKILGVDYGDFTIGLAIFDLETDFIYPYKTIFRAKANVLRKSIRELVEIVNTENITDIVVGLPLNADGSEGDRVEKVKNFAHMLSNGLINVGIDTEFVGDDILSSLVGVNADIVGANACGALCTGEFNEPNISITFQDERLTTVEAKSILQERGIPKTEWKKNIDQIAAEIILQDYRQVNNL